MSAAAAAPAGRGGADRFRRQTRLGLALAGAIVAAWAGLHAAGVFLLPWWIAAPLAPLLVAAQCWLCVGLFIVAHDAMHGSLAPFRPRLNRAIGRVVLLLYAGIWYDDLVERHFAHHRAPGTGEDPDFAGDGGLPLWRWYGAFFREYLTLGQVLRFGGAIGVYLLVFRAEPLRLILFWAAPALLSSLQLFYFGTYLPHRREERSGFEDHHRARSNDFSYLLSLLTCFHFGYHHEHHTNPAVPWWKLPETRPRPSDGRP